MKSAITDVSYTASQTLNLKQIHSKVIVLRLNLNLTVLCTVASYTAADCYIRQDAHSRMGLVIARFRRAEERAGERGERAQDHQSVNGEKLFMSLSSAECTVTEVQYATEQYSESPPPVGTKTDTGKGNTAPRKSGRDFASRLQVELDSSSDEAQTSSRSIYLREIHWHSQIDHCDNLNKIVQRRPAHWHSTIIAMREGNAPAPQAVRPLAPALPPAHIPPLQQVPCNSAPRAPRRRSMRPARPRPVAKIQVTRHKAYFQRTFLKYFRT